MPAAEEEFRSILALGNEAAELAKGAENPYTLITTNVCSNSVYFLRNTVCSGLCFKLFAD